MNETTEDKGHDHNTIAGTKKQIWRHCRKCKRRLKNPKSQALGYGPICILEVKSEV